MKQIEALRALESQSNSVQYEINEILEQLEFGTEREEVIIAEMKKQITAIAFDNNIVKPRKCKKFAHLIVQTEVITAFVMSDE